MVHLTGAHSLALEGLADVLVHEIAVLVKDPVRVVGLVDQLEVLKVRLEALGNVHAQGRVLLAL